MDWDTWDNVVNGIITAAKGGTDVLAFLNGITAYTGTVVDVLKKVIDFIKNLFEGDTITNTVDFFKAIFSGDFSPITDYFNGLLGGITGSLGGIGDFFKNLF
ncbi:MAG: hypothetical protein FWF60_01675 [Oscillospiraceae bacterium]|nr:hypothetical protein [Oscillospiraceae bacterium]